MSTNATPGMSSPRAATSVATSTGAFCGTNPGVLALGLVFVAVHGAGAAQAARLILRSRNRTGAWCRRTRCPRAVHDVLFKTAIARSNLLSSSKISTVCVMLVLAVSRVPPSPMRTCVGSFVNCAAIF